MGRVWLNPDLNLRPFRNGVVGLVWILEHLLVGRGLTGREVLRAYLCRDQSRARCVRPQVLCPGIEPASSIRSPALELSSSGVRLPKGSNSMRSRRQVSIPPASMRRRTLLRNRHLFTPHSIRTRIPLTKRIIRSATGNSGGHGTCNRQYRSPVISIAFEPSRSGRFAFGETKSC